MNLQHDIRLVDDAKESRIPLEKLLSHDSKYRVTAFSSRRDVLKSIKKGYDCSLLDLKLDHGNGHNGDSGVEVWHDIRQYDRFHPIIIYSVWLEEYEDRLRSSGVYDDKLTLILKDTMSTASVFYEKVKTAVDATCRYVALKSLLGTNELMRSENVFPPLQDILGEASGLGDCHKVAIDKFKTWANKFEDPSVKIIYFGERAYSPSDLCDEVNRKTELGRHLVEAWLHSLDDPEFGKSAIL